MPRTREQLKRIKYLLQKQNNNVEIDDFSHFQALQYVCENSCQCRALPKHFGKWGIVYQRFRRWINNGVFDRIENELKPQMIEVKGISCLHLTVPP